MTINLRRNSYRQQSDDYKARLEEIRRARREFEKYAPIMTEYERHLAGEAMQELKAEVWPLAANQLFAKHDQAIGKFKQAIEGKQKARRSEINRWDNTRLGSELQTAQMRLDQALKTAAPSAFGRAPGAAQKVAELYQEAKDSGDIVKMRAMAEVVRGIQYDNGTAEQRQALFSLTRKAESDLQTLRKTEEMLEAALAEQAAADELQAVREEIKVVGEELGEAMSGPFAMSSWLDELRRVQVGADNQPVFYERGAPETKAYAVNFTDDEQSPLVVGGN